MYYFIRKRFVKLSLLTLIPLVAAILLIINTTNVLAKNVSNEQTNQSQLRDVPTSPADGLNHNTSSNPSREINLTRKERKLVCRSLKSTLY